MDFAPKDSRRRADRRGFARGLAMLLLAASLGACSQFNFFTHEDVAPEQPADRLYNEGLYLLNPPRQSKKGGEQVRRGRPSAPLFGMGAQSADHVGLRLL